MPTNPPYKSPKHKVSTKLQHIHVNNKKWLKPIKTWFNPSNTYIKIHAQQHNIHQKKKTNNNQFRSIIRICIEMPQSQPNYNIKKMLTMPNNAIFFNHSKPDSIHQTQTSAQHFKFHQQHQKSPFHPAPDCSAPGTYTSSKHTVRNVRDESSAGFLCVRRVGDTKPTRKHWYNMWPVSRRFCRRCGRRRKGKGE